MPRVLWVACAQPGSLYPAVPIARELARRGHRLTVLCEPGSRALFESLGFGFRPADTLAHFLMEFDPGAHGGGRAAKLAWHAGYVRALYTDTSRALESDDYAAVMVDPLEPGADFAAESAGVPSFSYVHWRMSETGADVPFCFHFWDRERPAGAAFVGWWNEQRALVGLGDEPRPAAEHRWYRHSRALTLLLGLPELVEPKGALPANARRIGPTVWAPVSPEPLPSWIDELGRDRAAVLASVSTVGTADAELLTALTEAVRDEPVDVVATVAGAGAGELPALPPNVRIAPFVPHTALLPRVAAVVSHAGNGTVTHAACAGVPLLLLPAGRDQFEVARGAAAAGIALVLERAELDPAAFRDALRTLLHDVGYRERARAIASRAAAYDAPKIAADAVDELLRSTSRARRSSSRGR